MRALWVWLRVPRNLALLSAIGAAAGFLIQQYEKPLQTAIQPNSIVVSPQININNAPTNTVNVHEPELSPTPQTKAEEPQQKAHFPIQRNLGLGIPTEMLPEFSVTLDGIYGVGEIMTVAVKSALWNMEKLEFRIGAAPIDITVKGSLYKLSVSTVADRSATIVLNRAD